MLSLGDVEQVKKGSKSLSQMYQFPYLLQYRACLSVFTPLDFFYLGSEYKLLDVFISTVIFC